MTNGLNENLRPAIIRILLYLSLTGALLLPSIEISADLPKFELSDFSLPLLLALTSFDYGKKLPRFYKSSPLLNWSVLAFALLIACSILVNGRVSFYRDWFELFKLLKFLFFVFCFYSYNKWGELYGFLKVLFSVVFVFNILHYFDVLQFNRYVEPFYTSSVHIENFGVNSIGQPVTKRAIGTMGNCNNNAFYFLSFLILFIHHYFRSRSKWDFVFIVLALTGVFLCQSRIAFLSLILLLLIALVMLKTERKTLTIFLGITLLLYLVFFLFGNIYLSSIYQPQLIRDAGIGRLEQWVKILEAMPGHWVLGHAPDKEYFARNGIYAESEYFLVLFRYGVTGLLLFGGFIILNLIHAFKVFRRHFIPFAFVLVYAVNALTNTPFYNVKLLLVFALFAAIILSLRDGKRDEPV